MKPFPRRMTTKELIYHAICRIEEQHNLPEIDDWIGDGGTSLARRSSLGSRPPPPSNPWAMRLALNAASEPRQPVGYFCLGESDVDFALRLLSIQSAVPLEGMLGGIITEANFPKLTGAAGKLARSTLFIRDRMEVLDMGVEAAALQLIIEHDLELLIVDPLEGLLDPSTVAAEESLSEAAAPLIRLARTTEVPLLIVSRRRW